MDVFLLLSPRRKRVYVAFNLFKIRSSHTHSIRTTCSENKASAVSDFNQIDVATYWNKLESLSLRML